MVSYSPIYTRFSYALYGILRPGSLETRATAQSAQILTDAWLVTQL